MADKLVIEQNLKFKGQVTLEALLIFFCLFILLLGCFKIFFWANQRFVLRQRDYEATRVDAGSSDSGKEVDESKYPKLNIFGE
ncbi:MAG: hypothetical protein V1925_01200 [Candidatus Omnitrophota bacterium]